MHGTSRGRALPRGRCARRDRRRRRRLRRVGPPGPDTDGRPIALGSGTIRSAHGALPVPRPRWPPCAPRPSTPAPRARRRPSCAHRRCRAAELGTGFGPLPAMPPRPASVGAGGRDPPGNANVLRLLLGTRPPPATARTTCRSSRPTSTTSTPASGRASSRRSWRRARRRLAHPDPDEEGPSRTHLPRARQARPRGRGPRDRVPRDDDDRGSASTPSPATPSPARPARSPSTASRSR